MTQKTFEIASLRVICLTLQPGFAVPSYLSFEDEEERWWSYSLNQSNTSMIIYPRFKYRKAYSQIILGLLLAFLSSIIDIEKQCGVFTALGGLLHLVTNSQESLDISEARGYWSEGYDFLLYFCIPF